MGLRADIYKHRGASYSNGGISEYVDEVTIVNIDGGSEPTNDAPAVWLERGNLPNTVKVVPVVSPAPDKVRGPMYGGCIVSTSDGRFGDAIRKLTGSYSNVARLHDRFESQELYDALSR